jgi:hypothetical protein
MKTLNKMTVGLLGVAAVFVFLACPGWASIVVLPVPGQNQGRVTVNPFSYGVHGFDQSVLLVGTIDISASLPDFRGNSGSGLSHVDYTSVKLFADGIGSQTRVLREAEGRL